MKRTLTSLAVGAILGAGLTVAPAASADTPGCVSQGEFRNARNNMSKSRVHNLFDTDGRRQSIAHGGGYTIEIRSYRTCTRYGSVAVSYENGRLSAKSAVF